MPTASERVINRPLSGTEAKAILRAAFDRLLDNEGLLSPHLAYGRFAYTLTLGLHLDNAFAPESQSRIDSRKIAKNELATADDAGELHPELAAIEPAPLDPPSDTSLVVGATLDGKVTSPNEERLRLGLPVPVDVREQDGTLVTKMVDYPPQPDLAAANSTIRDTTAEQKAKWSGGGGKKG